MLTRNAIVTPEGHTLRVGTSRFLSQDFFLLYKFGLAVYFLYWAILWRWVNDYYTGPFMTHWTWYITTTYFILSSLSAFLCWRAIKTAGAHALRNPAHGGHAVASAAPSTGPFPEGTVPRPPLPPALEWSQRVLWSVACVGSLIVCAIFWGALYGGQDLTTVDVHAHAVIAVVMLVDQFLVADEFKLRYVMYAQAFGTAYLAFNVCWYYLAPKDDRLIYEIIDWNNDPLVACIYGLGSLLVLAPFFACLHRGVYRLRERLYERILPRETATALQPSDTELKHAVEV